MGQALSSKDKSAKAKRALKEGLAPFGLFPTAHAVQISGGSISVVGGDVHHHDRFPNNEVGVLEILKSIKNLRDVHIATLGRATPGTGLWIFEWETFLIWLDHEGFVQILWGTGMLGAGKTVLASIVINALETHAKNSEGSICVCYIYFRYSDHTKTTVRDFLEVLAKQTAERHPKCHSLIVETYASHLREDTQPTEDELINLLKGCIAMSTTTFYVLDALDEAPAKIQFDILKKLEGLNVKLFITSRPRGILEALFPHARYFHIVAQPHDLDLHIDETISSSPELHSLLIDAKDRQEVVSSIKHNCAGM